jgi:hypothetical protein
VSPWNDPLVKALERSLYSGFPAAGAAFFAVLAAGGSLKAAGIGAGGALFAVLTTRGAVEGLYDKTNGVAASPPSNQQ